MSEIILVKEEPRHDSIIVELPVLVNGAGKVKFPDVPQLRNTAQQTIVIKAMRFVTLDVLVAGMLTAAPNAPLAEAQKIAAVIYSEGWEKGQYIPLLVLNDVATPAGTFPYRQSKTSFADWKNVDFNKSYIQYANTTVSAGTPYVIMIEVEYLRYDAQGKLIVGPSA